MKLVLDASVCVAALRPSEPNYLESAARIQRVLAGDDEIVVPAIFSAEIAASLARAQFPKAGIERYLGELLAPPSLVITIGPKRALRIADTAIRSRLRSADASYAWVAMWKGIPLVTLDNEVHECARHLCQVMRP